MRHAEVKRTTRETNIFIRLCLDGTGQGKIDCGIPFMNHMLELFARHGLFDLDVAAHGDLEVDCHHTMEDLGLVLGEALKKALGDKKGIRRYGHTILPMDEALLLVALDLSGRPYLVYDVTPPADYILHLDVRLFHEFFQAFAVSSGMNLHIKQLSGAEVHHVFEGIFKALAKALDQATQFDPRIEGVLSTKGQL